jgi:amino acid transporter
MKSERLEQNAVGFPTALASAVGLIMASPVILTATTGFGVGGSAFAAAMVIAFVMMQAQATTFSEAAAMIPTAGSVYDYLACGLGRFWAITGTVSAYVLVHVFAGTAETILSGIMALVNFPTLAAPLEASGTSWLVGVALVVIFGITNMLGVKVFGKIEMVLTFGMWTTLTLFGIIGLLCAPAVELNGPFGSSSIGTDTAAILTLTGMAMFMFVGCEFVTPLAPELRSPARTIPRAMALGLVAVAVCMFLYGAAIRHQVANVSVNAAGTVHLLETPQAIPQFAMQIMGPFGRIWLGIGFLFAGAATINTLMAGIPRILYGMAIDGALPKAFAYLHPKYKTPVVGILVAMLIPCLHAWWIHGDLSRIMPLVAAAVCAWGVAYILVTVAVTTLRIKRPELPRAYRSPAFPLPQILSTMGILVAIWFSAPPGMTRRDVFVPFGVMLGLTALYALWWTRYVQKVPSFRPVAVEDVLEHELGRRRSIPDRSARISSE